MSETCNHPFHGLYFTPGHKEIKCQGCGVILERDGESVPDKRALTTEQARCWDQLITNLAELRSRSAEIVGCTLSREVVERILFGVPRLNPGPSLTITVELIDRLSTPEEYREIAEDGA